MEHLKLLLSSRWVSHCGEPEEGEGEDLKGSIFQHV